VVILSGMAFQGEYPGMFRHHAFVGVLAFLCAIPGAGTPTSSVEAAAIAVTPATQQITQAINDNQLSLMADNVRPEVATAIDQGRVDDSTALDHMLLLLHRPKAQEQALEEFMAEQTTPGSANYQNWLTAEQFGQYGVAQSDLDTMVTWLESHGFIVNQVHANGVMIDFSGTAGQVRQSFKTEMHRLSVNGMAHVANMSVPQIPLALAPAVVGIVSMNDFRPHTNFKPRPEYTFGSPATYALVPADLATIYNLNPLFKAAPTAIDGAGQTIALIEDEDIYLLSDLTTFRSTFGLPAQNFSQAHPGCADPGDLDDGTDFEVELDIEWAGAAAPGATLHMESCGDTAATFGGLIAMQNLNSSNDTARLWSVSYGECEAENGAAANAAYVSTYQNAAARGVSVFVASGDEGAASCDPNATRATHGVGVSGFTSTPYNVSVGGTDFGDTYAGTNSTYWNATNTATYGSAKSYINEIPWNNSCASVLIAAKEGITPTYGLSGFCNSATGTANFLTTGSGSGGPSGCATGTPFTTGVVSGSCAGTAKPAWQSGVLGNPADGVRDIPDVALFAANGVWGHYWVACYSNTGQGGAACTGAPSGWASGGGTSFASPIMAGIQALVNQKTGSSQGNPNPAYYSLATAEYGASGSTTCNSTLGNGVASTCTFYDVTQGDMDVNCTGTNNCYRPSGTNGVLSTSNSSYAKAYGTGTGWDFATGIGSVNAANLVNNWPVAGKLNQTITFTSTAPTSAKFGGPTYTVAATASSGLTVVLTIDASATSACSLNGATVSFIGAGTCVIDANQAGDGSYNAAPQAQQSFSVGAGSQTITFPNPGPQTYSASGTFVLAATASSGLVVSYASNTKGVCTVSGSTATIVMAGSCSVTASQAGNTNYSAAAPVIDSIVIGTGSQSITFTSTPPTNTTVGGPNYTVTAMGGASGNPVTFSIDAGSTAGACTISGATVSFTGAGSCIIDANQAGNANYSASAQARQVVSIGAAGQTITFTSMAVNPIVSEIYSVTAIVNSGLPVTLTIDGSAASVCSISNGGTNGAANVSFNATGTCVIDANQGGSTNYSAAPQVQQSFTVGVGAATQLVFTTQPSSIIAGSALGSVVVTEEDQGGTVVNDSTSLVNFTVAACGGSMNIGSVTLANGVGAFNSSQRFYTVTTGLHINANAGALSVPSATFDISSNGDLLFANDFESCRL
jgi:hypothetical protein